jgi:hypothetical protein
MLHFWFIYAITLACPALEVLVPLLCKYDTPASSSADPHATSPPNRHTPAPPLLHYTLAAIMSL